MSLLTVDDLAASHAKTYTVAQSTAASLLIEDLEADLEAYLGKPLVPTVFENQTARTSIRNRRRILLPKTPVLSVEAFTINGSPVSAADYRLRPWGIEDLTVVSMSTGLGSEPVILISYTAGLPGDDPEEDFTRAAKSILRAAARRLLAREVIDDAPGVSTLDQEGYSVSYGGISSSDPGSLFHPAELDRVSRWKKRTFR